MKYCYAELHGDICWFLDCLLNLIESETLRCKIKMCYKYVTMK